MTFKVYLAGPMTGTTPLGANGWRERAGECLLAMGIRALSPLRGKGFPVGEIDCNSPTEGLWSSDVSLTRRDYNDCTKADAVLMNLAGAEKVSVGTLIELGWATAKEVPVVVILDQNNPKNPYNHPMVRALATCLVGSLRDGVRAVRELLIPAV